jgi:hypothetical protein
VLLEKKNLEYIEEYKINRKARGSTLAQHFKILFCTAVKLFFF